MEVIVIYLQDNKILCSVDQNLLSKANAVVSCGEVYMKGYVYNIQSSVDLIGKKT